MGLDSFYEDEINFGREEAIRMHATHSDWQYQAERWLRTTTGQEYLDELIWDTVGLETQNAMLQSFGAPVNAENRRILMKLADRIINEGF
jgi:hypothetical protein